MDPHANIVEAVSLASAFVKHPFPPAEDVARLGELVIALHDWRMNGGFDPYVVDTHAMATDEVFRITEQDTRITEVSYDLALPGSASIDDAQHAFEALTPAQRAGLEVHREIVHSKCEITGIEPTGLKP